VGTRVLILEAPLANRVRQPSQHQRHAHRGRVRRSARPCDGFKRPAQTEICSQRHQKIRTDRRQDRAPRRLLFWTNASATQRHGAALVLYVSVYATRARRAHAVTRPISRSRVSRPACCNLICLFYLLVSFAIPAVWHAHASAAVCWGATRGVLIYYVPVVIRFRHHACMTGCFIMAASVNPWAHRPDFNIVFFFQADFTAMLPPVAALPRVIEQTAGFFSSGSARDDAILLDAAYQRAQTNIDGRQTATAAPTPSATTRLTTTEAADTRAAVTAALAAQQTPQLNAAQAVAECHSSVAMVHPSDENKLPELAKAMRDFTELLEKQYPELMTAEHKKFLIAMTGLVRRSSWHGAGGRVRACVRECLARARACSFHAHLPSSSVVCKQSGT
jgi:hypothetical protein